MKSLSSSGSSLGIGTILASSFKLILANPVPLILYNTIITILIGVLSVVVVGFIVGPALLGSSFIIGNKVLNKEQCSFSDIFSGFKLFLPNLLASLTSSALIVLLPYLCFLLLTGSTEYPVLLSFPYIILVILLYIVLLLFIASVFGFAMVEVNINNNSFGAAFGNSISLCKSNFFKVMIFAFVTLILSIILTMTVIGSLIVTPLSVVALLILYSSLTGNETKALDNTQSSGRKPMNDLQTTKSFKDTKFDENQNKLSFKKSESAKARPDFSDQSQSSKSEDADNQIVWNDAKFNVTVVYTKAYLFIENRDLSAKDIRKVLQAFHPEAASKLKDKNLVSMRVAKWPQTSDMLKRLIASGIKEFQTSMSDTSFHTDSSKYKIKVFTGKDSKTKKDFALALVSRL